MRNEDFGRISRLLAAAIRFARIRHSQPHDSRRHDFYNTIGEIAGTDKKDEVIMLGGHLDSWHAATGATDNAVGCAIMMEAARILKTLGVKPRRTIRVALWSGEEQGLLGSQAYVKKHFGSFENPTRVTKNSAVISTSIRERDARADDGFRTAGSRDRFARSGRAVRRFGRCRRDQFAQPRTRRFRSHLVQPSRTARHRRAARPDRIRHAHLAHESRHLRANCRRRREKIGGVVKNPVE
jgi:hypothetical protein